MYIHIYVCGIYLYILYVVNTSSSLHLQTELPETEFQSYQSHVALCLVCLSEKNTESEINMKICPSIVTIFGKISFTLA